MRMAQTGGFRSFADTRSDDKVAPLPVIAGAAKLNPKRSLVVHRQWAFRGLLGDMPLFM